MDLILICQAPIQTFSDISPTHPVITPSKLVTNKTQINQSIEMDKINKIIVS
jgi:hypothetical protein